MLYRLMVFNNGLFNFFKRYKFLPLVPMVKCAPMSSPYRNLQKAKRKLSVFSYEATKEIDPMLSLKK